MPDTQRVPITYAQLVHVAKCVAIYHNTGRDRQAVVMLCGLMNMYVPDECRCLANESCPFCEAIHEAELDRGEREATKEEAEVFPPLDQDELKRLGVERAE